MHSLLQYFQLVLFQFLFSILHIFFLTEIWNLFLLVLPIGHLQEWNGFFINYNRLITDSDNLKAFLVNIFQVVFPYLLLLSLSSKR